MKSRKPVFHSVLDLGLRDVGLRNEPRRFAARLGRFAPGIVLLALVAAVVGCVVLNRTGAGRGTVALFALLWTAAVLRLAVKFASGAPVRSLAFAD